MAIVQDPNLGQQIYYAFAEANSDQISHFRSFGNNVIGLEDSPNLDFDFDDNMVSIQIRPLGY